MLPKSPFALASEKRVSFREVLEKRPSNSQPEASIVKVRSHGVNQDGQIVLTLVRHVMVYKKDHAPATHFPEVQV